MSNEQKVLFEIVLENGEFKVNAKESADALGKVGDSAKKSENAFSRLKSSWVGTTLAVGALALGVRKLISVFGDTVKASSKLQETQNKFDVVFKNSKKQADAFAKALVESYGMAKEESMSFLAGTGDILTGLGMQSDKALELSNSVAQLGTDLASFSNVEGGAERAIGALTSALTGEREALKAYGIVVSEEMVKSELVAQGKEKLTGLALNQAKAEATIAIAYAQSGNAIGDMTRSFNSYANIQRRVESSIENQKAGIGDKLIPALSGLGLVFLESSKDGGVFWGALQAISSAIAKMINGLAAAINLLEYAANKGKKAGAESFIKTGQKGFADKLAEIDNYYKDQAKMFGVSSYKFMMEKAKAGDETAKKYIQQLAQIKKDVEQAEKDALGFDNKAKAITGNWTGQKDLDTTTEAVKKREAEKNKPTASTGGGAEKQKQADMVAYYGSINELSKQATESLRVDQEKDLANAKLAYDQKLITKQEFEESKLAIEAEYKFKAFEIEQEMQQQSVIAEATAWQQKQQATEAYYRASFGFESQAFKGSQMLAQAGMTLMNEKNKALFNVGKAATTANIGMNTAEAVMKGMSYGPFIGIPYAALVGTTAAIQLAQVYKQKPPEPLKVNSSASLPSFAVGAWAVPYDMTAKIHKDEMIVSKPFADSVRDGEASIGGGSGGGTTIIVQGSVIDAQGLLNIVDQSQQDQARRSGRTIYSKQSAY